MMRPITLASWICGAALASAAPAAAQGQAIFTDSGNTYSVPMRMTFRDIPFRTVVRQQFDYSCGSAALATLLHYHYGMPVNEAQIFVDMWKAGDQSKIRRVGFSLLDMKNYLAARGLTSDGYRENLADIEKITSPSIAVIKIGPYKHFVVIKGVRGGKVLVGDPAQGLKIYPLAEFGKMWNGIIFAIHDTPTAKGAYNREGEWRPFTQAPLGERLDNATLAGFTRELPPIYQITNVIVMNGLQ